MFGRRTLIWVTLAVTFVLHAAAASAHAVPRDREALRPGDWLPYVVSKLGPLEWWAFASSPSDLKREDYPDGDLYQESTAGPFPRFCFLPFRAKPETMRKLNEAIEQYQGDIIWQMEDTRGYGAYEICIVATGVPGQQQTFIAPLITTENRPAMERLLKEELEHPFWTKPGFQKRAMADIPKLGAHLEAHLDLRDKPSLKFDSEWLTADGLARMPGQFEDFDEPGDVTLYLTRDPQALAKSAQTSPEEQSPDDASIDYRVLSFGLNVEEIDIFFSDLGQKEKEGDLPSFPLLSRMESSQPTYQPAEIEQLLAELRGAQHLVKDPVAVRCFDKLRRMAAWAHKLENGIYLSMRGE